MLVRAAWIPKECDRCNDDWTHRPDSMSTEALSGRNYLCESHYEDAKVILQQRQHRAEAVAPVSQIVSVPVSVTPVVKQPESASSEALEEHTANKNRYELSPNEHDDLASYVKNRSSQSVPTPDCVPNLADAEQPERNRSQNGLTATDNQKSCQDGIETKDVTESLSTKMAKVMLMPVKEPKQPTAALAALSVAPARTPNCASEEFCSGSGFVNRPHLYCSPDCKLNFYRNHLASWMESHEWVANRLTQAWVYLYFIKGTTIGYIGQDSTGNRLHDHERGRYSTTAQLNVRAAESGTVTTSMRWQVDLTQHDLSWWEKYYADKYRAQGWTLVNIAPLSLNVASGV